MYVCNHPPSILEREMSRLGTANDKIKPLHTPYIPSEPVITGESVTRALLIV